MNAVASYYMEKYNLEVNYSSPALYTSLADGCSISYNQWCSHGDDLECTNSYRADEGVVQHTIHHKNQYNILYNIAPSTNPSVVKLLLVGHQICRSVEGRCQQNIGILSAQYGLNDDVLGISTAIAVDDEEHEKVIAIHEFGHFFGIKDHKSQQSLASGYSDACLYGSGGEQMTSLNDIAVCDGCYQDMKDHINKYMITEED